MDSAVSSSNADAHPKAASANNTVEVRIQNVVATVTLGLEIELEKVAQAVCNVEYNPTRFAAVIMRIREPKTTALIFKSGKMVITGAKSRLESSTACRKYVAILQKVIDAPINYTDFKIQNMTGTCDAGFPIRLEALLYAHASTSTYEPELFPGLVYRLSDPKVVVLIFVSGKLVITGAKSEDILRLALQNIYQHLLEFRKRPMIVNK